MNSLKQFFNGFKNGMADFGKNIALIVQSALLLIVYLVGVGLTSLIAKIFSKRFLDKELSKTRVSYWSNITAKKESFEQHYRQF
jgi:hypothetical protein